MTLDTLLLSLTTTVGSEADAQHLARGLLEARLAACVQVEGGLVSHYRWQGGLHADPEWRLTAKTLPALRPAVEAFLAARHPYSLPQVLWQALDAGAAYAAWVQGEVSAPAGADPGPPA